MSSMSEDGFEMEIPPDAIVQVVRTGSFHGGPLDGSGFFFQVTEGVDLDGMRVSLPTPSGLREVYAWDDQPDPNSLEAGLLYIARTEFTV